jgi:hypothetical protein
LDGLPEARVREDPMIVNDMMQVPGFDLLRSIPVGACVFQSDRVRLTLVLANRLPLEEQLGADLVYYNETYKAVIIVQYKVMERDGEGALFRLPNAQLANEISRMDGALVAIHNCHPNDHRDGFRFSDNPFFLKLCPRLIFNPDDKGLTPGMYLPLDYWRLIEADDTLKGPNGGRQITFGNVGRYLDNTEFIALVTNAWVGTTAQQSQILTAAIRNIVQSGRALTLAVKTDLGGPGTPTSHLGQMS